MNTLFQVTMDAIQIEQELMDLDGELTPELEARIDALLAQGADKFDAAAYVLRSLRTMGEGCKTEAARLSARNASFLKAHDALKLRMFGALKTAFGGKLKTTKNTFYTGRTAARTSYDCKPEALEALPLSLVRVTRELNKSVLAEMDKAGEDLPPGIITTKVEGSEYLGIK